MSQPGSGKFLPANSREAAICARNDLFPGHHVVRGDGGECGWRVLNSSEAGIDLFFKNQIDPGGRHGLFSKIRVVPGGGTGVEREFLLVPVAGRGRFAEQQVVLQGRFCRGRRGMTNDQ